MTRSDDNGILDLDRILREWRWRCPQRLTLIDRNAYGDLFLRHEAGRIHKLDIGSGEFAPVAGAMSEFDALKDTPEKLEEWFAETDARDAAQRGLVPSSMQCIAFDIPIVFAESVNASPYLADIYEDLGFLGDLHRQLSNHPDGSKVKLVIKPDTGTA